MRKNRLRSSALFAGLLLLGSASLLPGQTQVTIPPIDFSGVIYSNYQYRTDVRAPNFNKFDVERAYLTFRMPAGDHASIRVTTDVYQQQNTPNDAYYAGWTIRLKYAYLQYNYITAAKPTDFSAVARMGMLHTVLIDHEENFWPRWISQTDVERAGLFSSADAGIATQMTLPNKFGEIYAAVTNGPGYASRELDRFKDPQIRLTITPLSSGPKLLSTWAISPWYYKGEVASKFVAGGAGQVGPVGSSLDRNRYGIFTGIRDPRLALGAQYAQFKGESETGANTIASPRGLVDSTGHVVSGFAVLKPLALFDTTYSHLGFVARYDKVTTNTTTNGQYHVFIGGLILDLNRRASLSFDYQEQLSNTYPVVNGATVTPTPPLKTYFVHLVANF